MTKRRCKNWIDTYLEYTDNTEPPQMYKLWCAISALATVMERKCSIPWGGSFSWYPNMYIVLVGPPGQVRKSTAMRPVAKILSAIEDLNISASSTTREALIRALAESNKTTFYDNDNNTFDTHCSMTIFASELAVFIGGNSGQLMSDLTDWFDSPERWEYRTKHQGDDIVNGVWVNMLGATTPDLIEAVLPVEMIGSGFASRIIFVYEQDIGKLVPFPIFGEKEKQLEEDLVHDIKLIHEMKGEFKVTPCFMDAWGEWYKENSVNPPFRDKKLVGYVSRRPTHIMKLCMILSASKNDKMIISAVELAEADRMLGMTEKKMPNTFSGLGRKSDADIMNAIMVEIANHGKITYTKLLNKFYTDIDHKHMDNMIEALRRMDFLEVMRNNGEQTLVWKKGGNADSVLAKSLRR